jgi:hypothetical protein
MEGGAIIRGQSTNEAIFSITIFLASLCATGLFAYYLVTDQARLTEIWLWTRSQNILVQGVIWLLFLPWMLCLWVWSMPWALPIRLVLVVAALIWTTWLMWPWKG